jgi:BirA family biotin operon repressor/biotin-[acetyl-CoA-carboxylase] ligase
MPVRAPIATASQLALVAAVAVHAALLPFIPVDRWAELRLKWPNDVLLGGAKLSGILLESVNSGSPRGLVVLLGIGVNVAISPSVEARQIASLGLGLDAISSLFEKLREEMPRWIARWDEGRGFSEIKNCWEMHAYGLDEPMNVNLNGQLIQGTFKGLTESGALLLQTEAQDTLTITAGEVFPGRIHDPRGE